MNVPPDAVIFYMWHAYHSAQMSNDINTKNGAVLVRNNEGLVHGWNRFAPGYGGEEEHHERPFKYSVTEHAERDVIYRAAAAGIKTFGTTMVANWVACPDCARAIVTAGIAEVICHQECMDMTPDSWADEVALGLEILDRGGVELIRWSGWVGIHNLRRGEDWVV